MKKSTSILAALMAVTVSFPAVAKDNVVLSTDAYIWVGDTIYQDGFKAWTTDGKNLKSTYHAQPGYYMPIKSEWTLTNDITPYPQLETPNRLHQAIYNLGLDEMVNAVELDTTLRTGKEWAGVWTRDVSYSIILSMAYLQPLASKVSLMKKVNANGQIIQDTGSGGAWPVSSDRMIWAIAAYEVYKVTGDRQWLEYIYPIIKNSLYNSRMVVNAENGLVNGETSFIDWRVQSYPKWMEMSDIYRSQALGTSIVHAQAWRVLSEIATILGHKDVASEGEREYKTISDAVNRELWLEDKGYYAMYNYGRDFPINNPRAETLGESLAILFDVADPERAKTITENNPTTPYGVGIFFPQIADMTPYHNNSLWPWVASYWAIANAKAGNEEGVVEAIGSVFRPAALFTTNKENFVLDNGDIATELNSSNMLWCLSGNIALTHKILFGINFEKDGIAFKPFVPKTFGDTRSLTNFKYRNAILDITVGGYGDRIKSFKLNGKEHKPFIPATIKGYNKIDIVMADNNIAPLKVNRMKNVKAPLTPMARLYHNPEISSQNGPVNNFFEWNPIEYINHYLVLRDGKVVDKTNSTTYEAIVPGEYQVIGVDDNGVQSFASEPLSNVETIFVDMPGETNILTSKEVSYEPVDSIAGYQGNGFVEFDHATEAKEVNLSVESDGEYAISLRYANGNGPISTENKCAVRTLSVDGERVGVIVMPQRGDGNWSDWGYSNIVKVPLTAGVHTITIDYRPENENMNLTTNHAIVDRVRVARIK